MHAFCTFVFSLIYRNEVLHVESSIRHVLLVLCQGNDAVLEVFTVLSEEEVQKKMAKKLKRAKKKAAK